MIAADLRNSTNLCGFDRKTIDTFKLDSPTAGTPLPPQSFKDGDLVMKRRKGFMIPTSLMATYLEETLHSESEQKRFVLLARQDRLTTSGIIAAFLAHVCREVSITIQQAGEVLKTFPHKEVAGEIAKRAKEAKEAAKLAEEAEFLAHVCREVGITIQQAGEVLKTFPHKEVAGEIAKRAKEAKEAAKLAEEAEEADTQGLQSDLSESQRDGALFAGLSHVDESSPFSVSYDPRTSRMMSSMAATQTDRGGLIVASGFIAPADADIAALQFVADLTLSEVTNGLVPGPSPMSMLHPECILAVGRLTVETRRRSGNH
jgi:hypothetical protein